MEYTKKVDGSKGLKTTVELCDANERSVRATVFLDADGALAFELGSVVALRSARVSIWQGVVGLALSVGGVVIAPDVPQAAALRSAAVAIVDEEGKEVQRCVMELIMSSIIMSSINFYTSNITASNITTLQ